MIGSFDILRTVAGYYGLTPEQLVGPSRVQRIARPRHLAMFLADQKMDIGPSALGRTFDRDHSTVIQAIRKIGRELHHDPELHFDWSVLSALIDQRYPPTYPQREPLVHKLSTRVPSQRDARERDVVMTRDSERDHERRYVTSPRAIAGRTG